MTEPPLSRREWEKLPDTRRSPNWKDKHGRPELRVSPGLFKGGTSVRIVHEADAATVQEEKTPPATRTKRPPTR